MAFTPPERFNLYDYLLGDRIREGRGARTALAVGESRISYQEVARASVRWSRYLGDRGVRPGERVLIALPDGSEYVAALFGILHLGGVVVMVNPHLKADEVAFMYTYTGARAALVPDPVPPAFAEARGAVLRDEPGLRPPDLIRVGSPEVAEGLGGGVPDGPLPPYPSHRDDAAVWLFSGGTTGRPKGVVQSHRSFANTTELFGKGVLGIGPDDVTLSVPKLYFGYATGANLFFPFSVGAAACLFPERCTAPVLAERIRAHRPTLLINVPTMVNHLLALAEGGTSGSGGEEVDLSSLRLSTSAGEALPPELHRRWDERFGVPLLDGLGTAEMWHIFISNRPDDIRPGTLGRVVPGFEVRVRDEEGRDLPRGEVGYLWVRGDSLAQGYWRNADKTRAAFRGEWYVSGDMISMDDEGYVTYCGRGDDMLKVSGKWLSPAELEGCLAAHPAIQEVAVVGVPTPEGLTKPEAFVIPADPEVAADEGADRAQALAAELQAWARERLQPYKYPRAVHFMTDFPRTHLGKVDRNALGRSAARPAATAPRRRG